MVNQLTSTQGSKLPESKAVKVPTKLWLKLKVRQHKITQELGSTPLMGDLLAEAWEASEAARKGSK